MACDTPASADTAVEALARPAEPARVGATSVELAVAILSAARRLSGLPRPVQGQ